jgi:hypothetical protein
MSTKQEPFTLKHAVAYNARLVDTLASQGIPCAALEAYPSLSCGPNTVEFAQTVMAIQKTAGLLADGKLGPQTWRTLLTIFERVEDNENYVVWGGRRMALGSSDAPYRVINFDEPGGYSLHEAGHFSAHALGTPQRVMLHWGGLDPAHLHAVMSVPDRKVSTHFGVGLHEDEPVVMQYIDLAHKTWHAGKFNTGSIGVDICQQPSFKWNQHYRERGYDVRKIKNPTHRGDRNIITLEPRIAKAANAFVHDLLDALELKKSAPEHHDVVPDISSYTLLGHHHVSSHKWDVACWWEPLTRPSSQT